MPEFAFAPAVLNPNAGEIALNMKILANDDGYDSRYVAARKHLFDNAWEALKFSTAANAEVVKHLGNLDAVGGSQVGTAEQQQATSPIRTGTGDTVAASAYPANRSVDQASAGIAAGMLESVQTNITTQVSGLTQQITALGGTITTALQAIADSNALIASALSALKPASPTA